MENLKVQSGISTTNSENSFFKPGMMIFSYLSSPSSGWLNCNGQELSKTDPIYSKLFQEIGITYGETNGSGGVGTTHFKLPNMSGKYLIPVATGTGVSGGTATHSHSISGTPSIVAKDTAHTHTSSNSNTGAYTAYHNHNAANIYVGWAQGSNPINANKTGNAGSVAISGSAHQHVSNTNSNWGASSDGYASEENHGHTVSLGVNASNNLVATVINATNQVQHLHNVASNISTTSNTSSHLPPSMYLNVFIKY